MSDLVPLPFALAGDLATCRRCGTVLLAIGWAPDAHDEWHRLIEKNTAASPDHQGKETR